MADATGGLGGIDSSSYPKFGQGNRLMSAAEQQQSAMAPIQAMQGITNLSQSQFDLAHKQLGALNQIIGSVAALPNPTQDDVRRGVTEAVRMGVLPAQHAASALAEVSQLATNPDGTPNPGGVKRWLVDHLYKNAQLAETLQAGGMAAPTFTSNGSELVPTQSQSGLNPQIRAVGGSTLPIKLSPSEKVQTQGSVSSTGQSQQIPVGQLYDERGNFIGVPVVRRGGGAQTAAPVATQNPIPPGTGPAAAPSDTQPSADQSPGLVTGLSPAVTQDRSASAKAFTDLRDDVGPSRMREFTLNQALGALRGTNTGLGTEGRQKIQNYLASLPGGIGKWAAGDVKAMSDYDLAKKYLKILKTVWDGDCRGSSLERHKARQHRPVSGGRFWTRFRAGGYPGVLASRGDEGRKIAAVSRQRRQI